ncbi:hypothetical protein [Citrobacter phage Tr1]|nr:hypothetical protein [Citrobacter phage Tr1]
MTRPREWGIILYNKQGNATQGDKLASVAHQATAWQHVGLIAGNSPPLHL